MLLATSVNCDITLLTPPARRFRQDCLDRARELVSAYAEFSFPASTTASDTIGETPAGPVTSPEGCKATPTPVNTTTPSRDSTAVTRARTTTTPPQDSTYTGRTPSSSIRLDYGGFAEGNYCDATLVYAACIDIDDAMMMDLARQCRKLRAGARVVTIGKPLPCVQTDLVDVGDVSCLGDVEYAGDEGRSSAGAFEVAWQCQVEGCWGAPAVAYVHHRVHPGQGL